MTGINRYCKYFLLLCAVGAVLLSASLASAGVKVVLADDVGPGQYFLVISKISNHALHGSITDSLDESFMAAGEVKNITVLMTKPLIYNKVYSQAIHPAYYGAFASSEKKPSLISRVTLKLNDPKSWRAVLDNDIPLRENGALLNSNLVNDHFRMVLQYYLPAYDRHAVNEDIGRYLPLFREMAAFCRSEKGHARYRETFSVYQQNQAEYEKNLAFSEGRVLGEIDQRLRQIEALFGLDRQLRTRMHDWKKMFHKGAYVYHQVMHDEDRGRIQQFMETNRERSRKSGIAWANADGVEFRMKLNSRSRTRNKDGSLNPEVCYSVSFTTDLNPLLGFRAPHYRKNSHARICRKENGLWELR